MINAAALTLEQFIPLFIKACVKGDLTEVKYLLKNCYSYNVEHWTNEGLKQAAFWGMKNVVDFFIEENKEKNINYNLAFRAACCNNLEMVQYLANRVDINNPNEEYLTFACKNNQLDIVDYLLNSSVKGFVNANSGQALLYALLYRKWNIVDYLLYSEELKEKADIHIAHDAIFHSILTDSTLFQFTQEIIKKLIFDYQIAETEDIKLAIEETKSDWANSMFRTRELHGILDSDLSINKAVKKSKL